MLRLVPQVLYDAVEDLSKKRIVNQMNDDGNPSIVIHLWLFMLR
jgi:hypothetical protein